LHESEAFICKALKGEAIVNLLRSLNNAADESLRLARRADNLEVIKEEFQKYPPDKKYCLGTIYNYLT